MMLSTLHDLNLNLNLNNDIIMYCNICLCVFGSERGHKNEDQKASTLMRFSFQQINIETNP